MIPAKGANHRFRKELLPPAAQFYASELGKLGRPSRGWARGNCPFHESKSGISFAVNLDSGGFYCFGCGAKGGDVISFLMLRESISFRRACEILGAWTDGTGECGRTLERARYDRIATIQERIATEEKRLRMELRAFLHSIDAIERDFSSRLQAERESETCWEILSSLVDEKRRTESAYYLLSFGSAQDRASYVLNENAREGMVSAVMLAGYVRGDSHVVEVPL